MLSYMCIIQALPGADVLIKTNVTFEIKAVVDESEGYEPTASARGARGACPYRTNRCQSSKTQNKAVG